MNPSDDGNVDAMKPNRAFDLLADDERRRAVAALRAADGTMDLDELAAATVARVDDVDLAAVAADRRERTAALLHHVHLPKLEDADVVEYDPVSNRVDVTERAERLDPYFEVIAEHSGT